MGLIVPYLLASKVTIRLLMFMPTLLQRFQGFYY